MSNPENVKKYIMNEMNLIIDKIEKGYPYNLLLLADKTVEAIAKVSDDILPERSIIDDININKLIRDVYDRTNSQPEINSQGYATGVLTYDTQCENYLKIYANCDSRQVWNSDVVRHSILTLRPVLTTGQGTKPDGSISKHAFIIDGYLLCKLYYGAMSASTNTGTKELV